jgi:alkyl hydroperoxide reductase subunit AhpC
VLGVIQENPFVAKAWAERIGTTLPLLADVKHEVARAYGVWDETNYRAVRTTLTIDQAGVIRAIHQAQEAIGVDAALEACAVLQRVDSTAGQ